MVDRPASGHRIAFLKRRQEMARDPEDVMVEDEQKIEEDSVEKGETEEDESDLDGGEPESPPPTVAELIKGLGSAAKALRRAIRDRAVEKARKMPADEDEDEEDEDEEKRAGSKKKRAVAKAALFDPVEFLTEREVLALEKSLSLIAPLTKMSHGSYPYPKPEYPKYPKYSKKPEKKLRKTEEEEPETTDTDETDATTESETPKAVSPEEMDAIKKFVTETAPRMVAALKSLAEKLGDKEEA